MVAGGNGILVTSSLKTPRPGVARAVAHRLCWLGVLSCLPALAAAQQFSSCGSLDNGAGYGPFDIRTALPDQKQLVEGAHFTAVVEALIRGVTARLPGGDIDYTLRAFPNHHRALLATVRLAQRDKTEQPSGMRYTVDCWFDRAIRFRPNDPVVRMLYVRWLAPRGQREEAMRHLAAAETVAADNAFTHYNLGLSYLELGEHEKALNKAHVSRALGMQRTELADALRAAGRWKDPPAAQAAEPAASAASSAAG